jgi:phosphopantothenate-cysteine ligase
MKHILITGGPTNEPVDEVMKITNMSTGSLSLDLAKKALDNGCFVTLIITNSVTGNARYERYGLAENPNLKTMPIETTQDMYDALKTASEEKESYDVIIHASAVGDYKPEFTFRMEDMAEEISGAIIHTDVSDKDALKEKLLKIMTDPKCKANDDSKISSYEPHLTVKLTLTTKLIANLRNWFPNAFLIGFKLLENVPTEELVEVAQKLCIKNNMDMILANDLAELNKGNTCRYVVKQDGFTNIVLNAKNEISLVDYAGENWFK